ncbi:MAG: hypothetical protein WAW92_01140, partial [Minisyncoccia bacterium]
MKISKKEVSFLLTSFVLIFLLTSSVSAQTSSSASTPTPTPTSITTWGGTPNPNAIVISPSGSDSNPCTISAPCKTLDRAQSVVRNSGTKIVYLRAGVYPRTQSFILTSDDNNQTWQTYPGDPVDSATLDASGMVFR